MKVFCMLLLLLAAFALPSCSIGNQEPSDFLQIHRPDFFFENYFDMRQQPASSHRKGTEHFGDEEWLLERYFSLTVDGGHEDPESVLREYRELVEQDFLAVDSSIPRFEQNGAAPNFHAEYKDGSIRGSIKTLATTEENGDLLIEVWQREER